MIPCTAIWRGVQVFVEVNMQDVYENPEKLIAVFQDLGGQILMHETTIGELLDIKPEFSRTV